MLDVAIPVDRNFMQKAAEYKLKRETRVYVLRQNKCAT
jgi:hypothetical protein